MIPLIDSDLSKAFEIFDPRLMFVSRDGPELNRSVKLGKDFAVGVSILTEDPPAV